MSPSICEGNKAYQNSESMALSINNTYPQNDRVHGVPEYAISTTQTLPTYHHENASTSRTICQIHKQEVAQIVLPLLLSSVGVVFTVISIVVAIKAIKDVNPSLRGILISYSFANLVGTVLLTFDIFVIVCQGSEGWVQIGVIISISMFLSLFHIMFLLLAEYQIVMGSMNRPSISSFSGLIVVSWIISLCIGCSMIVTTNHSARITFVVLFILAIIAVVADFASIVKQSVKRFRLIDRYKRRYLDLSNYLKVRSLNGTGK